MSGEDKEIGKGVWSRKKVKSKKKEGLTLYHEGRSSPVPRGGETMKSKGKLPRKRDFFPAGSRDFWGES